MCSTHVNKIYVSFDGTNQVIHDKLTKLWALVHGWRRRDLWSDTYYSPERRQACLLAWSNTLQERCLRFRWRWRGGWLCVRQEGELHNGGFRSWVRGGDVVVDSLIVQKMTSATHFQDTSAWFHDSLVYPVKSIFRGPTKVNKPVELSFQILDPLWLDVSLCIIQSREE